MAANDTNYYRARALDLQVTGYHNAVHALLDRNPDGFLDRSCALQAMIDRLVGFSGQQAATDTWALLREQASEITGVRHGPLHTCVREQVLGRLVMDQYRSATAPAPADFDAFAGLPS